MTKSPGWYPHPQPPQGSYNYLVYFDGTEWTDYQAGWLPDPENPGKVRYWNSQEWIGEAQSPQEIKLDQLAASMEAKLQQIFSLPPRYSPQEDQWAASYPAKEQLIENTRSKTWRSIAGTATNFFLLSLFIAGLSIFCIHVVMEKLPSFPHPAYLVLLIPAALVGFTSLRGLLDLRDNRKKETEAFLCSVSEAEGLPEGILCTVTGAAGAEKPFKSLGSSKCVFYKGRLDGKGETRVMQSWTPFYLKEDKDRIWVEGTRIDTYQIGEPKGIAWRVAEGDQVSLTGRIITREDGSRGFAGRVELNFPVAAYTKGETRLSSASQAESARPEQEGRIGPADVDLADQ